MAKRKSPKIVVRKLGREKAAGIAFTDANEIHIDPRQDAREMLDTFIHEKLHFMYPKWPELKVEEASRQISEHLWELGYRLVNLK